MMKKKFIEGSNLLGVALALFGLGFVVPDIWAKGIMFIGASFYFLISMIEMNSKEE